MLLYNIPFECNLVTQKFERIAYFFTCDPSIEKDKARITSIPSFLEQLVLDNYAFAGLLREEIGSVGDRHVKKGYKYHGLCSCIPNETAMSYIDTLKRIFSGVPKPQAAPEKHAGSVFVSVEYAAILDARGKPTSLSASLWTADCYEDRVLKVFDSVRALENVGITDEAKVQVERIQALRNNRDYSSLKRLLSA